MRAVVSVIVGYLVMAVIVMAALTVTYLIMGTDSAFKPGTYEASMTWIIVSFVLGLIAAIVGGLVCAMIARTPTPPMVLATIVLLLGFVGAWFNMNRTFDDRPAEAPAQMTNLEAMQWAEQPMWVAYANPVIGAIGVVIGAGLVRKKPSPVV